MTEPITIEDYDPRWPEHFQILRMRIAAALDGLTNAIEHVGSTAVPRLAAKPIIDIDVLLRSTADLPLVISRLAALGYGHQGDLGITGREAFLAPSRLFPHHLYVCPPDSRELARHILFRDYLRTHSEDAQAYAVLKRSLASRLSADREAYTQAKSVFVEAILCRATQDFNHLGTERKDSVRR